VLSEYSEYVGWHIDDLGVVFWQGDFCFLFHIVSRATVKLVLPIRGLEMVLSLE